MDAQREELLKRISIDPNICFGKPCIRGHRMWVSLIVDILAEGVSIEDILKQYPGIEKEDILACIAYGSGLLVSPAVSRFLFIGADLYWMLFNA